ncbi:MAG: TlyA family RNA methyltransferase [Tenuifilaceae bacterium]|jgi:23S rRNA (cytidine1920-2'-O)/16S rRNA (cytidine1409-2'-O)-methyltransferase|nr:TlyA family RNA methyltransferase [Tenuifilaceae bacterium]
MRLDVYLVSHGFFASREQAKFNISKGNVIVNGKEVLKSAMQINSTDIVELAVENVVPYVSRGGLKLEKAIREFQISCNNKTALDVGASTGGFTDCLLKHGAKMVCAVDVGTNQLDSSLRGNPNVYSIENINIKDLNSEVLPVENFDIIVADLSFISLTKVLEYFPQFLNQQGIVIVLIKPQFEVGPELVGKGGIVKNPKVHSMAIENVAIAAHKYGLFISQLTWSPIHDSTKNVEYLAFFSQQMVSLPKIEQIVSQAFASKS